jgi:hypothetical protein
MARKLLSIGLTAFLLLFVVNGLAAQDKVLGVKGGFNIADLDIENENTDTRTGFVGGVYGKFGINDVFSIQPEVLYSRKGASSTDEGVELDFILDYIEVPVLLVYNFPVETSAFSPSLYAGPAVSFEAKCEVEATEPGVSLTVDCEEVADVSDGEVVIETKGVDFGLVFGGGIDITAGSAVLVFDVRYNYGLTDIDDTGMVEVKNRAFSIMGGIGFPIGP